MSNELWDAYYPDGTLAGVDLVRGEKIPEEYRHAVAEVFVVHEDGTILLMQRDFNKITYPGYWESTAGGSVLKGESFLEGAKRELYEETGIKSDNLTEIYTIVTGNAIYKGYYCETDIVKYRVRLQEGETMSYKWVSYDEYLRLFNSEDFVDSLRERQRAFVENRLKDFMEKDITISRAGCTFRFRGVGILIRDNHVLMCHNKEKNFYYETGRAVRMGETTEDAAIQEIFERSGLNLEIDRLLFTHENFYDNPFGEGKRHEISYYYLMDDTEALPVEDKDDCLAWIPIDKLDKYKVYPEVYQEILPNMPEGVAHIVTTPKQNNKKKYILNPNVALRSWQNVPYAYYVKNEKKAKGLTKDEFEILCKCDGIQEMDRNPIISKMIARGVCKIALIGDSLTEWQKPRICDNLYFPSMNWMLTGKCNYNCQHCYNASDNAKVQCEFNLKEAYKLIEEAAACGVNSISLTGGDPVIHIYFTEILRKIYEQGMFVDEINTNGFFITKDMLVQMKRFKCVPLIRISFDGIGYQDTYRNREGSEKRTLAAIKLCIAEGFDVNVQFNLHRYNKDTLIPTLTLMDKLGVHKTRIVRLEETSRLKKNLKDASMGVEEYFEYMLGIIKQYYELDCNMVLDIAQMVTVFPGAQTYVPRPVEFKYGEFKDTVPLYRRNHGEITVGASGNLYTCQQMSEYYEKPTNLLGNVKEDGLQIHLREGRYVKELSETVKDLKEVNHKCAGCRWMHYCGSGSRAMAYSLTGDKMGCDTSKCIFFEKEYLAKLKKLLPRYNCTSLIMEEL